MCTYDLLEVLAENGVVDLDGARGGSSDVGHEGGCQKRRDGGGG